jgi:hypothetical protein
MWAATGVVPTQQVAGDLRTHVVTFCTGISKPSSVPFHNLGLVQVEHAIEEDWLMPRLSLDEGRHGVVAEVSGGVE